MPCLDRSSLELRHEILHLLCPLRLQVGVVLGQNDPARQINILVEPTFVIEIDLCRLVVVERSSEARYPVLLDNVVEILNKTHVEGEKRRCRSAIET